jgi:hypothetical protein
VKNCPIHRFKVILLAPLACIVLAGCSGEAAPLSKKEAADFKGGPMPANAREEMAKRFQQSKAGSMQKPAEKGAAPP